MFNQVGDFVRNGDTTRDPIHSTVVAEKKDRETVFSINRIGRKLYLHAWTKTEDRGLEPLRSVELDALKKEFVSNERKA